MCRGYQGLGWLPALLGLVMIGSIVTTYLIAVWNGNVEAFFPYISDTGVGLPERCIFSQFINIAAAMAMVTMYLRYKLITGLVGGSERRIRILSRVNLVIACLSCLGLSMVANFQETGVEPVHFTGAFMVFGLGVVYAFTDATITYMMHPYYNGLSVAHSRLAVAILGLLSLIITTVSGVFSFNQRAAGPQPPDHSRLHWKPDDAGYAAHLVSTFGEWAVAAAFMFYYITYIPDFNKFHIEVTPILHVAHLDESIQPSTALKEQDTPPPEPDEHSRLIV